MTAVDKLRLKLPDVIAEYFSKLQLAEEARNRETKAVTVVQAAVRGFLVRQRLKHLSDVARAIQKCWRGYTGRQHFKAVLEEHNRQLRQRYFDHNATQIQRHWRGFWSRKYVHNFYARKAYLDSIRAKNEAVRNDLSEEAERAIMVQRQMAEETARKLFDEKIGKLHHLVSTKAQPGIFNSPFAKVTGTMPIISGHPVEEHLKASVRVQVTERLPPIKKITVPKPAYPDPRSPNAFTHRQTLRQTAGYTASKEQLVLDSKIHKAEMLNIHPLPFSPTSTKEHPHLEVQSNRNLEQYTDPWDPTIGNRNDTFTATQQRISPTRFLKYQKKQPFFDPTITEAY